MLLLCICAVLLVDLCAMAVLERLLTGQLSNLSRATRAGMGVEAAGGVGRSQGARPLLLSAARQADWLESDATHTE